MITLTKEHQIAYQTAIEVITKKAEKKRKQDQRFWFILVFSLLCIAFLLISKDWYNINYLTYLGGMIVGIIILFWILPLGKAREMNPIEIRYSISAEMKKQSDDLNFIERQRNLKESAAKLDSEAWSYNIEEAREKWRELQPKFDETIATLKTWGEKLDMALEYYEQHENAVNTW